MSNLNCPYCDADLEVNHDDGAGYAEDERHEMTCRKCDKTFVFTTYVSFSYEASQADCLNGGEHKLKITSTYPRRHSLMRCKDCDYMRTPTHAEFAAAGITEKDLAE